MCWNKWHHPPSDSPSWYFQVWVCVRKSGGSRDEGETFEDEERCLNPHPLFWVPAGGVYMGKASHVLFRGSCGSVLDQGLIERGCDCCFLHECRLHGEWRWTCDHHSWINTCIHWLYSAGGARVVAAAASLIYLLIVAIVHALQARCRHDGARTHAAAMRHAGPQGAQFYPVPN